MPKVTKAACRQRYNHSLCEWKNIKNSLNLLDLLGGLVSAGSVLQWRIQYKLTGFCDGGSGERVELQSGQREPYSRVGCIYVVPPPSLWMRWSCLVEGLQSVNQSVNLCSPKSQIKICLWGLCNLYLTPSTHRPLNWVRKNSRNPR